MADIKVNSLIPPTWNRLKVNDITLQMPDRMDRCDISFENKDGIKACAEESITAETRKVFEDLQTGAGAGFDGYVKSIGCRSSYIEVSGGTAEGKVNFDGSEAESCMIGIEAKSNTESLIYIDISGADLQSDTLKVLQIRSIVRKGSKLKIVELSHPGDNAIYINDLGVLCEEDASFELVRISLGGSSNTESMYCELAGNRSHASADIGYVMSGERNLDQNYLIRHIGKETTCNIASHGALRDRAQKTFRGSIDFITGCSGSQGEENEDILLMDDTVGNKTVPLILCGEEDVAGAHGASIGRPDEEQLYYITARGTDIAGAYRMLAKAKIDSACMAIENEEIMEKVSAFVENYDLFGAEAK